MTKKDTPSWSNDKSYKNSDDEVVRFTYFDTDERNYYLVNTSGNIQKNKLSGLKDGNDCYYYVNNQMNVVLYTDNKTLKSKDGKPVDKNDGKTFIEKYLNGSVDNN